MADKSWGVNAHIEGYGGIEGGGWLTYRPIILDGIAAI
jgi:hypothetical protein